MWNAAVVDVRYWVSAVRSLTRNAASSPGFARELATSGLVRDRRPAAATRRLADVVPGADGIAVDLGVQTWRVSNMDPTEKYALGALVRILRPRRIFEIGTFDGATTLLLARNAPQAEVLTLDLPPAAANAATVLGEQENATEGVGRVFAGAPEASRITQLFGDSRSFDFSPWYGSVDVVLVDGGHDYDCVGPDTDNAYKMVTDGGVIVWDDYTPGWPDVVRAVDSRPRANGSTLVHIASTDLAIDDPGGVLSRATAT